MKLYKLSPTGVWWVMVSIMVMTTLDVAADAVAGRFTLLTVFDVGLFIYAALHVWKYRKSL